VAGGLSDTAEVDFARSPAEPWPKPEPLARSSLEGVLALHLALYREFAPGGPGAAWLRREGIQVLHGLARHRNDARRFFRTYYAGEGRRIALVGLNPGRFGGGRTGLPFLDPLAVSALLGGMGQGRERSARFLWGVIARLGPERFFERVYLTNLSCLGFVRGGRNVNLDQVPGPIRSALIEGFVEEMRRVRPLRLVPLGRWVESELSALAAAGRLAAPVAPRLPHPRHAAFPSRREGALRLYLHAIGAGE
jgi:hypothetical protein